MGFNILCVDELELTKIELTDMLGRFGIQLFSATDEAEAIAMIDKNKEKFGAIIWAVNSAEYKDFDAIKKVKDKEVGIPLIIVSQFTGRKYVIKAIEAGACEYIAKPYDETAAAKKICKVLGVNFEPEKNHSVMDEDIVFFNFSEMLSRELKSAGRGRYTMSIMMVSVVGREGGALSRNETAQEVMKITNKVIKLKLRENDTVFGYGPNNLMILLPFADKDGAQTVENKIRNAFEDHSMIRQKSSGLRLSVSSVTFPDDGKIKEKLLEKLESRL